MQGRFDDAITFIREARDLAAELRDLDELSRSYVNLGQTLDSSGHVEEAAEMARDGVAMCEREGIGSAEALLWAGDPREAARVVHAELATYTAQDDDPVFVPPVLALGARAEAD